MSLNPSTREFLKYLHDSPEVRSRIAAEPDRTLLYAGGFFRPAWQEIAMLKTLHPRASTKQTLPEVLQRIATPGQPHPDLLAWAKALDALVPWQQNGFILWRALSGIFASNARGAVSFCIGSGVRPSEKVFAASELPVLLRNPNVDGITKDILSYFQRCVAMHHADMNFGVIRD